MPTPNTVVRAALRGLVVLLLAVAAGGGTGRAVAADFSLRISASPSPATQSSNVLYEIGFTNTSNQTIANLVASAQFAGVPAQFVSATNVHGLFTTFTTNNLLVRFTVTNTVPNGGSARFQLVVRPTTGGYLTNTVSVVGNSTALIATNLTLRVLPLADVGLGLAAPAGPVLVNDWITYSLILSNRGPGAAANLTLSNSLPAGWRLLAVTNDAGLTFAPQGQSLRFTAATLASNAVLRAHISVQPTNVDDVFLLATATTGGSDDPDLTNNLALAEVVVRAAAAGQLVATTVSTQRFDPQTGLMRQTLLLSNAGPTAVAAARVIITQFTNRVFNAVGTNDGHPFVTHNFPLDPGEAVMLELEYVIPARSPVPDPVLVAVAVPAAEPSAPSGTSLSVRGPFLIGRGRLLIEWASVPGRTYTILYSDDAQFTNSLVAVPPVTAVANRTQWVDEGPPKTVSRPDSVGQRFYRVLENP